MEIEMKVRDRMTHDLLIVSADSALQDAASLMRDANVGMLAVHQDHRLVGVITDRDITVRAVAKGVDAHSARVADFMSRDLAVCHDDDEAQRAAHRMKKRQVRRLLVVNHDNKPVGVMSLGDLATEPECAALAQNALSGICQVAGRSPLTPSDVHAAGRASANVLG